MAAVRFSLQDIDRFNDRISNVLQNTRCRPIYDNYLRTYSPSKYAALQLWLEANSNLAFNEELFIDLIDEVDEFNTDPLLSFAEPQHKLMYIKQECCRILESTRQAFVNYLRANHM